MNYGLTSTLSLTHSECLVIGIFSDTGLPDFLPQLGKSTQDLIKSLSQKASEPGNFVWQSDVEGHSLLLIQCGKQEDYSSNNLLKRINEITDELIKQRISSATLSMPRLSKEPPEWQLEQMIVQIDNLRYQLLDFKTKNAKSHRLESITFHLAGANESNLKSAQAIAAGVEYTRHLANMPANICTPTYLGEQGLELAKQFESITCKVMGKEDIQSMGMGAF